MQPQEVEALRRHAEAAVEAAEVAARGSLTDGPDRDAGQGCAVLAIHAAEHYVDATARHDLQAANADAHALLRRAHAASGLING